MKVFFIGGASQAKLCHNILTKNGHEVPVVYDHTVGLTVPWNALVLHDEDAIAEHAPSCEGFLVCLGGDHSEIRSRYSRWLRELGLVPVSALHPTAFFGDRVKLGDGVQAMARSVVNDGATIGDWTILNTNCSVDHECVVGSAVHVMGGAVLTGRVKVGDFSSIGSNATVLPSISVGVNCRVGAGAVVTKDVPDNCVVTGVPATVIRQIPPVTEVSRGKAGLGQR